MGLCGMQEVDTMEELKRNLVSSCASLLILIRSIQSAHQSKLYLDAVHQDVNRAKRQFLVFEYRMLLCKS